MTQVNPFPGTLRHRSLHFDGCVWNCGNRPDYACFGNGSSRRASASRRRPPQRVNQEFTELFPDVKTRHQAKVFHAGKSELLPASYKTALESICDADADRQNSNPSVFLCAAYDPYDEVIASRGKAAKTRDDLLSELWVPMPIDMVIRTGGDCRMSGFLPLQCKYAELFFETYNFPDISRARIEELVTQFLQRTRRLGK